VLAQQGSDLEPAIDRAANILITGAAGGLGKALAVACARRGAQVLLTDRNLRGLEAACDEVEAAGGPAPGYCQLDLAAAGPESFAELLKSFIEAYGSLDGLVHCAAHFRGLQPLEQVAPDEWLTSMQVNLNAAWLLSVVCLPSLKASQLGRLVFILNDQRARGSPFWGAYGVANAALEALVLMFAEEMAGSGCHVFGVRPGPMRTHLRATAYLGEHPASIPEPRHAAECIAALLLEPADGQPAILDLSEQLLRRHGRPQNR